MDAVDVFMSLEGGAGVVEVGNVLLAAEAVGGIYLEYVEEASARVVGTGGAMGFAGVSSGSVDGMGFFGGTYLA